MLFKLSRVTLLPVCLALWAWGSAFAALDLERTTTLRDAFGGEFSAVTTGQVDIPGRDLSTNAQFINFHPGDEQSSVNGVIQHTRARDDHAVVTLLNGELVISGVGADNAETIALSFDGLQLINDALGRELSGTVVVNGEAIDAAEMPRAVAVVLRRVLRFLRYH